MFIGNLYRNPAATSEWYEHFTNNLDIVLEKDVDIVLLGDFNIDFLKPAPPMWESTISLFDLRQLVDEPTRITPTSKSLLDHIYTNKPNQINHVSVACFGASDHFTVGSLRSALRFVSFR